MGDVSAVISVRLRGDEIDALERAAAAAGVPLSTFIRQAALSVASPLDMRAVSAQAETFEIEARRLLALLRGKAS
ncbi:ribbon-helix-helix protein, CopG family [Pseudactinotalea sp. HY158]|uniref:plasmid mobilization protein n=1 Tax=Pseudactinotalea sp. HY158 TaxID=2654547 RepID=UPI00129C8A38|nr:ribbon-helix-helix protein, CopG family [Pseudactinotalea sp. HY158]QGH69689.1 ribbon-helix-helix protein, CopG family [Pseudactinotalea sp. HY158]